jgi:uncharacterized membrane protein YbhN (UPF0104 family)
MTASRPKLSLGDLLRVVGTLLAVGLLIYLLASQGWDQILASVRQITLGRFLLVIGMACVSRLAIGCRWGSLLLLSGIRLPLRRILQINYAGLFASNFLPTSIGGDIVRLAGAMGLESDRGRYVSSIAVDRLVGLAGMAVLLPVGAAMVLSGQGPDGLQAVPMLVPVMAAAAETSWIGGVWRKGVRALRESVRVLAAWISSPKALLAALGFTWLHMLIKFSAMRLLFSALNEDLSFWEIAGLWSFVYFISLFPVSINSLGLMELSTGLVFSTVGGAAVSSALTVALMIRTAETIATLPGVASLPGMLTLRRAKQAEEQQA